MQVSQGEWFARLENKNDGCLLPLFWKGTRYPYFADVGGKLGSVSIRQVVEERVANLVGQGDVLRRMSESIAPISLAVIRALKKARMFGGPV